MKNYKELSDSELDRLSAERLGLIEGDGYYLLDDERMFLSIKRDEYDVSGYDFWNPTNSKSNQVRYLIKALKEKVKVEIITVEDDENFYIEISQEGANPYATCPTKDFDKINRTKLIACLEADDKLKGGA